MKIGNRLKSKLGQRSIASAITAAVVAVVLLLNVAASVLFLGQRWHSDLTPDMLYTLTEDAERMLGQAIESANATRPADQPVQVDIIFCADPDILCQNDMMRYIYYTALDMQHAYPDTIKVSTRDVWNEPTSVDEFRANKHSSIYPSNIIIASGSEFRVYGYRAFFAQDPDLNDMIWAYNGEKTFIKGILAVTRAEAPICALTVGHGEPFETEEGRAKYSELVRVIENAGYTVITLDLATQEIPENCRLILTFDPQRDFKSSFYGDGADELPKLDAFLKQAYSFMVFVDADTPQLPALEERLDTWGISLQRKIVGDDVYNCQPVDPDNRIDGEGTSIIAQYEPGGLGGILTESMRENGGSPKILFQNAISIGYSPSYKTSYELPDYTDDTPGYAYGSYYKNGNSRSIFDIFHTGETSYVCGKNYLTGERLQANDQDWVQAYDSRNPFRLMTVTRQLVSVSEGNAGTNEYFRSYVCAIGSTEFASNAVLSSNAYGNTDVLLETLRLIGRETELVGLDIKPFYDPAMDANYYDVESTPTTWTVVLVLIPAIGFLGAGTYVLVKRRRRT